jgi:hypothetical protein
MQEGALKDLPSSRLLVRLVEVRLDVAAVNERGNEN